MRNHGMGLKVDGSLGKCLLVLHLVPTELKQSSNYRRKTKLWNRHLPYKSQEFQR